MRMVDVQVGDWSDGRAMVWVDGQRRGQHLAVMWPGGRRPRSHVHQRQRAQHLLDVWRTLPTSVSENMQYELKTYVTRHGFNTAIPKLCPSVELFFLFSSRLELVL